ncbi:Mini-chromosome maintenance complex-binding protein, variant 2 [Dionaea muscipula]
MVGLPFDCLANPLGAVRLTFEKAISSGSFDPSTSDGRDWGALDLFRRFLEDGGLSQVPMLNPANGRYLMPNTLVRFRGMVQDMLGNEFYVGSYKDGLTWRTNKYMDTTQFHMDLSPEVRLWERRLIYAVPVPGLNYWAEASEPVANRTGASEQREKRHREEDEAVESMELVPNHEFQDSPSTKKMREEGGSSCAVQHDLFIKDNCHFPLPSDTKEDSFPCLVKIYDADESDLKLNDVFEFVGVLSFDSDFAVKRDDFEELSNGFGENELVQLPPCKVPRIHCLVHQKLGVHNFLPSKPMLEPDCLVIRGIRQSLLDHLTSILGKDVVAAQFLLLHLLSQVHTRVDTVAVGKLSLNLTCFSKETASVFGIHLSTALKELLPFTHYIPLTVEYLNTSSLGPKKDYQTNRLVSGLLQLAQGSHLTFDETQLQSGTLDQIGVHNAGLLKNLIQLQQVEYDFQYYKLEMGADVQLLVLSEGKSNILPADLVLPFQPTSTGTLETVSAEALQAWRWYLATLRSFPHSLSPEMQKIVEQDLVAARQADRSLNCEDLSRLLTMAQLMSLSFGETCLSMEHWQSVNELERLRKERLK